MGLDDLPQGTLAGTTIECATRADSKRFTIQGSEPAAEFRLTLTPEDGDGRWVLTRPERKAYRLEQQDGPKSFDLRDRDITIR